MNRLATAGSAVLVALLATALPAGAATSGGFTDYRQAAVTQYGGNPPAIVSPQGGGNQPTGTNQPGTNQGGENDGAGDDGVVNDDTGSGTAPGSDTGQKGGSGAQGSGGGQGAGDLRTLNLVFLSPVDPVIVRGVQSMLNRLDGTQARILSLVEPLNLPVLATAASGTRFSQVSARRLALVRGMGRRIGREIVRPSAFFDRLGPVLFTVHPQLEAPRYVVFARSGAKLATRQETRVRDAFELGLVRGVRSLRIDINGVRSKVPTAGVETTTKQNSQIKWYKARKISSVDNIDTLNGERALLAILRDGAKGHFGVKETADRLLPRSVDVNPAAAAILDAKGASESGVGTGLAIGLLALVGAWTSVTVLSRARRSRRATR